MPMPAAAQVHADDDPEVGLTIAQVARLYGVGPRTVERMLASGQLKAYRVRKAIRIRRGDALAARQPH